MVKIELEPHELPEMVDVLNRGLGTYARGSQIPPHWLVPLIMLLEHRSTRGKPLESPVEFSLPRPPSDAAPRG